MSLVFTTTDQISIICYQIGMALRKAPPPVKPMFSSMNWRGPSEDVMWTLAKCGPWYWHWVRIPVEVRRRQTPLIVAVAPYVEPQMDPQAK